MPNSFIQTLCCPTIPVIAAFEIELVRLGVLGGMPGQAFLLLAGQLEA